MAVAVAVAEAAEGAAESRAMVLFSARSLVRWTATSACAQEACFVPLAVGSDYRDHLRVWQRLAS